MSGAGRTAKEGMASLARSPSISTMLGLAAPSHDIQVMGSDVSEWCCDLVHGVTVPLTFVLDTLCQANRVGALLDSCVLFADRPQSKQSHSLPVIQRAPFVPSIRSA